MHKLKGGLQAVVQYLGVPTDNTSHLEKLISALGAGIGIVIVYGALCAYSSSHALVLLVASVAASTVLVFAVPHGALSQPWPVIGSYLVSGLVGVTCHRWIDNAALAIPLSVGIAVWCMYYTRCLHPPGGAIALVAVTGGNEIQQLGYSFVLMPALMNAATLVCAGFVFNYLFPWRRYPVHFVYAQPHTHPLVAQHELLELTHEDYQHALKTMDSFIDIGPQDLSELVECAREHALMSRREARPGAEKC